MAMEVECVDYGPETVDLDHENASAADIVNGDGQTPANFDQRVADARNAGGNAWDGIDDVQGKLAEIRDGDNQEESTDDPTDEFDDAEFTDVDMNEQREQAEHAHAIEVADAKEEHFDLAVRRSEAEANLKELKADEKAALKNLKNLLRRGPNYPQPPDKIAKAVKEGGERSAIQVDDPNADESWKAIPTSSLLEGIKGMGDKKVEAVIALAPTLGDMEELRAQAGIAHKPFASVLPRGVGGTLADELEERVLDAVAKHCAARDTTDPPTADPSPDTDH